MANIRIEGYPIPYVGGLADAGHLYLVYTDDEGGQFVVRGGPENDVLFGFSDLVVEAGVPMYGTDGVFGTEDDTREARANTQQGLQDRGSRILDFGDRDLEQVWGTMVADAQRIGTLQENYDSLGPNSNTVIASALATVGVDVNDVLPNVPGIDGTDLYGPFPGIENVDDLAGNQHTITFSEFGIGTTNPTYTFQDNIVSTIGILVSDGAQPASPVIAANSDYLGPVFLSFENPVPYVRLDVGYFDNLGSTRVEFRDAAGVLLQSSNNSGFGVLTFEHSAPGRGIAFVSAIDESFDASGFSVDTVVFGGAIAEPEPPQVSVTQELAPTLDRNFGSVEGGESLFFSNTLGPLDTDDYIQIVALEELNATVRTSLNSSPGNARDTAVTFAAGTNYISLSSLVSYPTDEGYSAVITVNRPNLLPEDEIIDDLVAQMIGTVVFDLNAAKYQLLELAVNNIDSTDDAARILNKFSKAFGIAGTLLNVGNRIDNVAAAQDKPRQFFVELVDMVAGMTATAVVGVGLSVVGTPILGVLGGIGAGIVYDFRFSNTVRTEANLWYNDLLNEFNDAPQMQPARASLLDALTEADVLNNTFDTDFYLATHPDAAAAVSSGEAISALAYYLTTGITLGHAINSLNTVVNPENLALDAVIDNAANLYDLGVFIDPLYQHFGDVVTTNEAAVVARINDIRTDGSEFNFNAALSALANRLASDWAGNRADPAFRFASPADAAAWANTLTNGQGYEAALESLALASGIDLEQTSVLAAWGVGNSPDRLIEYVTATTQNAQSLIGLTNQSIGVANVGGVWILLLSTQSLPSNVAIDDSQFLRLFGTPSSDFILGSGSNDIILSLASDDSVNAADGNDSVQGAAGNDTIIGGEGGDTLEGGAGNDLLVARTLEPESAPVPANNGIEIGGESVQIIPATLSNTLSDPLALNGGWSLAADPDIIDATVFPHTTLEVAGSGDLTEAFSFDARAGETWYFDIDGASFDTVIALTDAGGNTLAENDDSATTSGAGGSTSGRDSFLIHTFTQSGRYVLAVGDYYGSSILTEDTFNLHFSIENAIILPSQTEGGSQLNGGSGHDTLMAGTGQDTLTTGTGLDTITGTRTTLASDIVTDMGTADRVMLSDTGFASAAPRVMLSFAEGYTILELDDNVPGGDGTADFEIYFSGDLTNLGYQLFETPEGLEFRIRDILGTTGDDVLIGTELENRFLGGSGTDTAIFSGNQSSYTLTLSPTEVTLTDRSADGQGADQLFSIELLDFDVEIPLFNDTPMNLSIFDGPASLTAPQFSEIIELYIAYFNRAPDALGLFYWATEFTKGFTIPMMAENFFLQPETQATYASVLDDEGNLDISDQGKVEDFVTEVYGNVLGRAPDVPGFNYWVGELLNNPNITPPIFILSIIGGAKYPSNPTPQTAIDQAYLATKSDLGAYFSVIKGMSDIDDATAAMALFDGSTGSITTTLAAMDSHYTDALNPDTGDFLMPLVGVIDDPFAI